MQDSPDGKRKPLVSVVIATYNCSATLERCLAGIASQTYPDIELVVMDGGSTDGTLEILSSNPSLISHWESSPDRGIYHAWNKAIAATKGDYLSFIGADDVFLPDGIDSLACATMDSVDYVFAKAALIDPQTGHRRLIGGPWRWTRMLSHHSVVHAGALHHRSLFERFGVFDDNLKIAADYDFLLRGGLEVTTGFVDKVVIELGGGGVSRSHIGMVLKETRAVQASHPAIGPAWASVNFALGYAKAWLKGNC